MTERIDTFSRAAQRGREPFLNAMFADAYFIPAPLNASVRSIARRYMADNFDKGAGFDAALPIPMEPPLIERLSGIRSPVLLLVRELDHPEVFRRNEFLLDHIPSSTEKVIVQAGHNTPLENTEEFLRAVRPFLQQLEPN